MGNSPDGAFALSLIGGLFILLAGIVFLIILIGVVGIVCGLIIIGGSFAAKSNPESAKGWGAAIIVLSLVSLISFGGFGIGFLLALIGGILFIAWEPPTPAFYYPPGGYGYPPPYGYPVQPYGYPAPAYPQYPQQAYGQYPQGYAQYPQQAYDPYQQQQQQAYPQPQQQQAYAQPQPQPNRPREPGQP